MSRSFKVRSLALGSLALIAALAPAAPDAGEDVKALAQAKVKVAEQILAQYREILLAPPGVKGASQEVAGQIQAWSRQVFEARLEAAADPAERLAILGQEAQEAREFETQMKGLLGVDARGADLMTVRKAEFARLQAEFRLAREKAGR